MRVNLIIGKLMIVCMSKTMYTFKFVKYFQPACVSGVYDSWHARYTSLAPQLAPAHLPSPPHIPPVLGPLPTVHPNTLCVHHCKAWQALSS